jgi:hypothetical protein
MFRAHKIELDPNAAQERYFACASGTARFAHNWGLAEWNRDTAAARIWLEKAQANGNTAAANNLRTLK